MYVSLCSLLCTSHYVQSVRKNLLSESSVLKMEVAGSFGMSVSIYQITRRPIIADHLNTHPLVVPTSN
jgi:hypothetical protein